MATAALRKGTSRRARSAMFPNTPDHLLEELNGYFDDQAGRCNDKERHIMDKITARPRTVAEFAGAFSVIFPE